MPVPRDPTKREFYVYRLQVAAIPFYVGVGRAARASDRVRYVRYLMRREAQGKPVKWRLSTAVIAALLRAGCEITVTYAFKDCTRAEALSHETAEIHRLLSTGTVLANIQQNSARPKSASDVVRAVLARLPLT